MSTGSSIVNVEESSSNRHACAACKHQRRKCKPNCILAPCFPSQTFGNFQSILDIFSVCKLTKLLRRLNESDRKQAARSFQWEAEAWNQDNVQGPLGLYTKLQEENEELKTLLEQFQQQNQILLNGMSADRGLIGQGTVTTTVPSDRNQVIFNQNWGQGSQMTMSNHTGFGQEISNYSNGAPQYSNSTDLSNHQGRVNIAIGEPSVAASQYYGNMTLQYQGKEEGGSWVLEEEDQKVVLVNQGGGCVAQGDYGNHHYPVSSLQGFGQGSGSTGTRYTYTPYPNRVQTVQEIRQENYDYYLLQQQQQQLRQHMSNIHNRR